MIFVIFGFVGFNTANKRDTIMNALINDTTGKQTYTGSGALTQIGPMLFDGNLNSFGARIEYINQTDRDTAWTDLKNALSGPNAPLQHSRIRNLDCPFDTGGSCVINEQIIF